MINIQEKQNSRNTLKLLAAQRRLYTEAKQFYILRFLGALLLASISPIIFLYWPASKFPIALISSVWILLSRLVLKRIESQKITKAALIQEQFDTTVFDIPWNDVLAGKKVNPETICAFR